MHLKHPAALYFVLVVVLLLAPTSCNPKASKAAMPCEDVLHPALWSVPFADLDANNLEDWIAVHFPDAVISPNALADFPDMVDVYWFSNGNGIRAHFEPTHRYFRQYPSDQPSSSDAEATAPVPTVADVLRCFGPPDLYAVRDIPSEVTQVQFSMWYLDRGMVFQAGGNKSLLSNKYYPDSKLEGPFTVVPPGSVEQMFTSAWTKEPQYLNALLAELKPWPKDFRSVE